MIDTDGTFRKPGDTMTDADRTPVQKALKEFEMIRELHPLPEIDDPSGSLTIEIWYDRKGIDFEEYDYEADHRIELRNIIFLLGNVMRHLLNESDEADELDKLFTL